MKAETELKSSADRLEFIDVLRGFALLGVFAANLLIFSGYIYMTDEQQAMLPTAEWDQILELLELLFIENKFMGLFSFMFGISFWLFLDRARARGVKGIQLFYSRLWWLFVIGAIHGWLFWCFDILRFYALWGLLLPLFVSVSRKKLLGFALFFAALLPALIRGFWSLLGDPAAATDPEIDALALRAFSSGSYREVLRVNWVYDWYLTNSIGQLDYQVAVFGRLLLGLCAARSLALTDLRRHSLLFTAILILGGVVGIGGNVITTEHYLDSDGTGNFFLPFCRRLVAELGYLSLTLSYASGLALLFHRLSPRSPLRFLAPVGSSRVDLQACKLEYSIVSPK